MMLGFICLYFFWRYVALQPDLRASAIAAALRADSDDDRRRDEPARPAVFVLCLMDGTAGPNRYGPDPKGRSAP